MQQHDNKLFLAVTLAISEAVGIPVAEILGRSRKMRICWARQVVGYLMVRRYGYSKKRVVRIMGRQHSLIINDVRRVEARLEVRDELFIDFYNNCISALKQFQ